MDRFYRWKRRAGFSLVAIMWLASTLGQQAINTRELAKSESSPYEYNVAGSSFFLRTEREKQGGAISSQFRFPASALIRGSLQHSEDNSVNRTESWVEVARWESQGQTVSLLCRVDVLEDYRVQENSISLVQRVPARWLPQHHLEVTSGWRNREMTIIYALTQLDYQLDCFPLEIRIH